MSALCRLCVTTSTSNRSVQDFCDYCQNLETPHLPCMESTIQAKLPGDKTKVQTKRKQKSFLRVKRANPIFLSKALICKHVPTRNHWKSQTQTLTLHPQLTRVATIHETKTARPDAESVKQGGFVFLLWYRKNRACAIQNKTGAVSLIFRFARILLLGFPMFFLLKLPSVLPLPSMCDCDSFLPRKQVKGKNSLMERALLDFAISGLWLHAIPHCHNDESDHVRLGSFINIIWWCWRMTPVARRIGNDSAAVRTMKHVATLLDQIALFPVILLFPVKQVFVLIRLFLISIRQ